VFAAALLFQSIAQYIQSEHVREQATFLSNTQTKIIDNMHQMQVATIQIQQWLTDISATRGQDGLNDGFDESVKQSADILKQLAQVMILDSSVDRLIYSLTYRIYEYSPL